MFTACNIDNIDRILDTAENIVENQPDSALMRLGSIKPPTVKTPEQQVRHILLTLYAKDLSDEDISNDSTVIHVIDYLKREDNPKYLAFAEYYLGRIFQAQGRNEQALKLYLNAKTNADKTNEDNIKGLIQFYIGQQYYNQQKHDDAIGYFESALGYFSKSKSNHKRIIGVLNITGNCFLLKNMKNDAMTYYNKALESAITAQDSANIMQNLGFAYLNLNDCNNAKQQLFHALKLNSDSTLQSLIYLNISKAYEKENLTDSAIYFAKLSEYILTKRNGIHSLATNYKTLSRLEKQNNNYHKAFDYLQQHLNYYTQIKDENILDIQKIETKHKLEISLKKIDAMHWFYNTVIVCLCLVAGITVWLCRKRIIEKKNAELANIKTELAQARLILENTKQKLSEAKDNWANTKQELSETQNILTNTCLELNEKNAFSTLTWDIILSVYDSFDKINTDGKFRKLLNNQDEQINDTESYLKSIFYKKIKWDDICNTQKTVFDKIRELYPQFTDMEYKIISLDYLNCSNSMIAGILELEDKQVVSQNKSNIRKALKMKNRSNIALFIAEKLTPEVEKEQE
jgi:tetratricopeptide (TPR) repeat protein